MEGDADVADLAFLLEGEGGLVGVAGLEMLVVALALGVHEIEIEIGDPAGLKLAHEERTDVLLFFEIRGRQLVGEDVTVAAITGGEAALNGFLAFAVEIAMRDRKSTR